MVSQGVMAGTYRLTVLPVGHSNSCRESRLRPGSRRADLLMDQHCLRAVPEMLTTSGLFSPDVRRLDDRLPLLDLGPLKGIERSSGVCCSRDWISMPRPLKRPRAAMSAKISARFVRTLPIPNQPATHHVSWRSANAQVRVKRAMRSKHTHQESMNLAAITGVAGPRPFDKLAAYAAQVAKEHSA